MSRKFDWDTLCPYLYGILEEFEGYGPIYGAELVAYIFLESGWRVRLWHIRTGVRMMRRKWSLPMSLTSSPRGYWLTSDPYAERRFRVWRNHTNYSSLLTWWLASGRQEADQLVGGNQAILTKLNLKIEAMLMDSEMLMNGYIEEAIREVGEQGGLTQ